MRHETCVTCRYPGGDDPNVRAVVLLAESLAPAEFTHHHHVVHCRGCGQWWFDDVVIGGLGIPVPRRRDTALCECADDLPQYTRSVVQVPAPERKCACAKADIEANSLPIKLGTGKGESDRRHDETVPRGEAVRDIAAHVADRDAFIVSAPPDALVESTARLKDLPDAVCYLDCGFQAVVRVRSPHLGECAAIARCQLPGTAAAVFIVSKTIAADRLSKLLRLDLCGVAIPADGSQDLLLLQTRSLFDLPALVVDAIGMCDPAFAAEIYANDLRSQS
jgi:hypothetical protein